MRQFLLGLLVAAFVWWGYGAYGGASPAAAAGDGAAPAPAGESPAGPAAGAVDAVIGAPDGGAANGGAAPGAPTSGGTPAAALSAAPPAAAPELPAPAALLPRLAQREPAALDAMWALLAAPMAQVPAAERRRLLDAVVPAGDDFAAMLALLGEHNTALHSAEGRALVQKVAAAVLAMPDADALVAGTQLLERLLRGRIAKADTAARAAVDAVYQQYRLRVDRWLCDPGNVAGAYSYTIQRGDSLARVAAKFRREHKLAIEEGTLAVLNRVHNPKALQVGQKIKVPALPVRAVLEKRSFGFAVYVGPVILRLYWVGHGENDKTPVTTFTVVEKQPQPEWTSPDGAVYPYGHPKNILGEYFLKFHHDTYTGFGAHGTPLPDTIGTESSMGCIRMYAADIEELFRILPRHAEVEVRANGPR